MKFISATYNLMICIFTLTILLIHVKICIATNYFYDDLNRLIRVQLVKTSSSQRQY